VSGVLTWASDGDEFSLQILFAGYVQAKSASKLKSKPPAQAGFDPAWQARLVSIARHSAIHLSRFTQAFA